MDSMRFFSFTGNSNFTIGNVTNMQFYPNMRFPEKTISYKISECTLEKQNNMEHAFEIISNKTILSFQPTQINEEISVTCDSKNRIEGDFPIAGEGGPTNITKTNLFSVVTYGQILLIKDSECKNPNVAIHELLHVLGFKHSENKENIMYFLSVCEQEIGQDQIDLINELYQTPTLPDLAFEDVSATLQNKYLDTTIEIKNNGLVASGEANILIYADDKIEKTIELNSLEIGQGVKITLENVKISKSNPAQFRFSILSEFNEIDKTNNEITLNN